MSDLDEYVGAIYQEAAKIERKRLQAECIRGNIEKLADEHLKNERFKENIKNDPVYQKLMHLYQIHKYPLYLFNINPFELNSKVTVLVRKIEERTMKEEEYNHLNKTSIVDLTYELIGRKQPVIIG